jgi:hypothetical protein
VLVQAGQQLERSSRAETSSVCPSPVTVAIVIAAVMAAVVIGVADGSGFRSPHIDFRGAFAADHCDVQRTGIKQRLNLYAGFFARASRSLVVLRREVYTVNFTLQTGLQLTAVVLLLLPSARRWLKPPSSPA